MKKEKKTELLLDTFRYILIGCWICGVVHTVHHWLNVFCFMLSVMIIFKASDLHY